MIAAAVDFGKAAADYATHRRGFPASTMRRLIAMGLGKPGQRVLDLGTGTGQFALEFARCGCTVTGLDPSEALIAKARQAAVQEHIDAEFVLGRAEETGLPTGAFDIVTAATCWHWFEKRKAAAEAMRVLAPGGRLVIAVLEWHFLPDNLLTKTLALVQRLAPATSRPNPSTLLYPEWTRELVEAGFDAWEMFSYVEPISYTKEGWRGRVRASQGVAPVMDAATLARFDAEMAAMLNRDFPEDPMAVEHRIGVLVAWRK